MRAMPLTDEIRAACAAVAERARRVRIREEAIEAYAATLPAESPPAPDLAPGEPDERRAAFQITLNAINFGSGWFPTLRKRPGMSGFRTVEAGLRARGPWSADELRRARPRRGRRRARPGPGARADGPVRDRAARARRQGPRRARRLVPRAGALGRLGRGARDRAGVLADLVRRLALRGAPGPVLQARADRRRRPRAVRPRARRRPPPPDAVRRQPRPARAAARRRARVRRRPRRPHRRGGADRARLARGGRDPRLRAARRRAARRRAPEPTTATAVDNHLWHRGGGPRYKARPAPPARGRPPTEARGRRAASSTAPSTARSGTPRRSASGTRCPCT